MFREQDLETLRPALMRVARAQMCHEDAEDIVSDALIRVWKRRLFITVDYRTYAFRILQRLMMDRVRELSRRPRVVLESQTDEAEAAVGVATRITPEIEILAKVMSASEHSAVLRAVRDLPKTQRSAVMLVGFGGLSYAEASKESGIHPGTLRSSFSRAKVQLRGMIGALN